MAVIRVKKTNDYTIMCNSHFKNKNMSLKAKGLLSLMLSLPDEWDYTIEGLVNLSKDGRDSVMNTLNELETFGYLSRERNRNDKGQLAEVEYTIYEYPQTEKPMLEKPTLVLPTLEKPTQLNTNNNKELNNKELNKYIAQTSNEVNELAIYELPLNDKSVYGVTKSYMEELHEIYPAVDLDIEFKKMIRWFKDNPTKKKTKRGITRFISSWLDKEQNKYHKTTNIQKPKEEIGEMDSELLQSMLSKRL